MWQEIIVGTCVFLAVVFLARRWLPFSSKKSTACGGCNGCGSSRLCPEPVTKNSDTEPTN